MAQDGDKNNNNHTSQPATSSESMNPGKDSSCGDGSKSSSHELVAVGAIDKGKGVVETEGEGEGGRSKVMISTPQVVAAAAAARDGRSGGRRGDRELHIATERERRIRMSEMFTNLHGLVPTLPDKVMNEIMFYSYVRVMCMQISLVFRSIVVFQADKSSIVMEAVHYIKSLEGTLSELEKRKLEMQLAQGEVVGATANTGVSSLAAMPAPTSLVAPAPIVLTGAGICPTETSPTPPVTAAPAAVGLQTWSGPNVVLSLSGNEVCISVCVARRPGLPTMVLEVLEKHNIDVVTWGISSDNARSMFNIQARVSKTLILNLAS
jgi:hypothetical protein